MSVRAGATASVNAPFQLRLLHDGGGELFNGLTGGVKKRNIFAAHQRLGFAYFLLAILQSRIAAVRSPLAADALQASGGDGQAKQLVAQRAQRGGQLVAAKVFGNEGVICRAHAELHR